ncbi:MAG: patatin-like phospholipase family protein [Rhodoferax sp.]|nr:patatin-like phospholipase family protein [Rhodoferax sp.]MCF8210239.1 patatin-like phospholipase family protein [Rhodoferax sp.]
MEIPRVQLASLQTMGTHSTEILATRETLPGLRRRSMLGLGAAALAGTSLTGCMTTRFVTRPSPVTLLQEPGFDGLATHVQRNCALVLSGGAARGFAHLGVLRVLERENLRPDLVVGSSAGAIVGALWASGLRVADIEAAADQLDWSVLLDFDPMRAVLGGLGLGLMEGDRLEQFLRRYLVQAIEDFGIPFAAVATDMENAEIVAINSGDAARAVRASCAVPGLYQPVRIRGRLLADGQIASPLPVGTARQFGARNVLAVDVIFPPQHAQMTNPVSMLFQSLIVSGWRHLVAERKLADVVVSPDIRTAAQLGLSSRSWVSEAGEKAAIENLPAIRQLFAKTESAPSPQLR